MTLFFDLHILERDTGQDYNYLVQALYFFYKGKILPKHHRSRYKPLKTMRRGNSFLINPESLFSDKSVDNIYKAQYIKLAGRRDYINYKINVDASLHLSLYPDINLQAIKTNPLIIISNNKLYFKHEE